MTDQLAVAKLEDDQDLIDAQCRAYDNMDKQMEKDEKKEELAGVVLDRIKKVKKIVKNRVRKQV